MPCRCRGKYAASRNLSKINCLALNFQKYRLFWQIQPTHYPLVVKIAGNKFVARAKATSSITSRSERIVKSAPDWLPMNMLSKIIIFHYCPRDVVEIFMSEASSLTISPHPLVLKVLFCLSLDSMWHDETVFFCYSVYAKVIVFFFTNVLFRVLWLTSIKIFRKVL